MDDDGTIQKKGWNWSPVPVDITMSRELTDGDKVVYGYLLWQADHKNMVWHGIEKIADDLGKTEITVKRSIRNLVEQNWIRRFRRMGSPTVTYVFERQEDCLAFDAHPDAEGIGE